MVMSKEFRWRDIVNTKIEVCIKDEETTTCRGGILEKLVAQVLKCQQYEVTQQGKTIMSALLLILLCHPRFAGVPCSPSDCKTALSP